MAKRKTKRIPQYKTVTLKGVVYYRTRIKDADGRRVSLYGKTCEELYDKVQEAKRQIEEAEFRQAYPTVAEYCEKWLKMRSATIRTTTLQRYETAVRNHIEKPIGHMYIDEVTTDDLRLMLVPLAQKSCATYSNVIMLVKNIFHSAMQSKVICYDPAAALPAKGGVAKKEKKALTDEQVRVLLDTIRDLPPYVFVMLGLYAGLRREEILALQWDCVFLDEEHPYLSVRRAWHTEHNRPVITTELKTPAARRDIPIPPCLVQCLKEAKEASSSAFVIANSRGEPLTGGQFAKIWQYIKVRSTEKRYYYRYINGESIRYVVEPKLGGHPSRNPKLVYTMDFHVSPHQLRYTYITNLIYAMVDPKTVQYLAGHENSRITMDVYAKVKYNQPQQLYGLVNQAIGREGAESKTKLNSEQTEGW